MALPLIALMGAQAGASMLSGLMGDRQAAKQVKAQNKQIAKQNTANRLQAEATVLSMEAQRSALRQQTAKYLELAKRTGIASKGGIKASAAASGIKGATVDSILGDVERDLQEKQFEVENAYEWNNYDLHVQQMSVLSQAKLAATPYQSYLGKGIGGHLVDVGLQAATTYAGQYFQFGSSTGTPQFSTSSAYGPTVPTYRR